MDEFGKKLSFILDGGKCKIGLESTVVNLNKKIQILRPGAISNKEISKILRKKVYFSNKSNKVISPGMIKKHYSPGIPIELNCKKMDDKAACIVFGKKYKNKKIF